MGENEKGDDPKERHYPKILRIVRNSEKTTDQLKATISVTLRLSPSRNPHNPKNDNLFALLIISINMNH